MSLFEICIDSVAGVKAAVEAGASRVELCASLIEGGITPSVGMVHQAVAAADGQLKVHVIIRPRGGDFLYSEDEFVAMLRDIVAVKEAGAAGVVIGLLDADGFVDEARTAELIAAARPLSVTFHRAFDVSRDAMASLDALIRLGVDRLLTSGQEPGVVEGAPLIRRLIERAAGRLVVMPGGDITPRNIARIAADTGAAEFHFAAFATEPSGMRWRNEAVFMGGALRPPEYDRPATTAGAIRAVTTALGG
ncbi:copper homeostasis protein CutC [Labrys monachus]|uniref:PF03932 family protein CutC n=1 Tax=Labrys monachus TaxID=217067 RepID=A0ABU0FJ12_9HYPH|nr:copper homeostasis protein CutC [Labrys monachus]MDQ0394598.1 copper homeostasis protein [Labrys monachus]